MQQRAGADPSAPQSLTTIVLDGDTFPPPSRIAGRAVLAAPDLLATWLYAISPLMQLRGVGVAVPQQGDSQ